MEALCLIRTITGKQTLRYGYTGTIRSLSGGVSALSTREGEPSGPTYIIGYAMDMIVRTCAFLWTRDLGYIIGEL